jgi:hypothetical protein
MSKTVDKGNDPTTAPAGPSAPDADRRRFLIAGLAAAPLIVTLSARPVFAQDQGTLGGYVPGSPDSLITPQFINLSTFNSRS